MRISAHHPKVSNINTLEGGGVHVIEFSDHYGGALDMFIESDWSDWDALVAKVEAYR